MTDATKQAIQQITEMLVAYAQAVPSHIFSDYADPANVEAIIKWVDEIFGADICNVSDWRLKTFPDEPGGPVTLNVAITHCIDLFFEFRAGKSIASVLLYNEDRVLAGECLTTQLDETAGDYIGWLSWAKEVINRAYRPKPINFRVLRPFCLSVYTPDDYCFDVVPFPEGQSIYINLPHNIIRKAKWLKGGFKGKPVVLDEETHSPGSHHKNSMYDMNDPSRKIWSLGQLIDEGWVDL